jgi:3-methyladenine DNA glycosylase/8-oxoguanine DNA glycosylase
MANYTASVRYLKRVDPILAGVIESVGPCRIRVSPEGTHFQALTRSIVFQQLPARPPTIFARDRALSRRNSDA